MSQVLQTYSERNIQRQTDIDEDDLLQGKFETAQREEMPNNTGLPDNLKSGIENLSGYSMNDVRVHYNSPKPAQLQAFAYTQGSDIHVAPGQEQHLPHEAWHVVQQKQGRVQPTMQLQGVSINDNKGLEHEADVMGGKVLQRKIKIEKSVRKTPSWKQFIEKELALTLVKNIEKERNTVYIEAGYSKSHEYYAEPFNENDVKVYIPVSDRVEQKRGHRPYKLEDNVIEKDRAFIIIYHELGHALYMLKKTSIPVSEYDIDSKETEEKSFSHLKNYRYHVIEIGDRQEDTEYIPLEEIMNIGFADREASATKPRVFHRFFYVERSKGSNKMGPECTIEIKQKILKRTHTENIFRTSIDRPLRIKYLV